MNTNKPNETFDISGAFDVHGYVPYGAAERIIVGNRRLIAEIGKHPEDVRSGNWHNARPVLRSLQIDGDGRFIYAAGSWAENIPSQIKEAILALITSDYNWQTTT